MRYGDKARLLAPRAVVDGALECSAAVRRRIERPPDFSKLGKQPAAAQPAQGVTAGANPDRTRPCDAL
jgi:hypothetical protein